jgi:hypothetical protein
MLTVSMVVLFLCYEKKKGETNTEKETCNAIRQCDTTKYASIIRGDMSETLRISFRARQSQAQEGAPEVEKVRQFVSVSFLIKHTLFGRSRD